MSAEQIVRRQKWERGLIRVVAGVACIALGGAVWAVVGTAKNTTEITQIQQSACAADPASLECQRIKAESDEKQPVVFACIPIRKIAKDQRLLALTKCQEAAAQAEAHSGSKGVVPSNGNSPSSEPGPPSHGGPPGGSEGQPDNPETSAPVDSGQHEPLSPTTPQPSPPEAPPVSESANAQPIRGTVESVTAPVKETVCSLPARLCP